MTVPSHENDLKGRRLLVVEDAFLIADMVAMILEGYGAEVVGPVGKLEPALELARREALDGALLDVDLGGVDSGRVAEVLRARRIPFLFLTAHCTTAALPSQFRDTPCVLKPFREDELGGQVASCLRNAAALQDAPARGAQSAPA